jgi:hypothetical protein
LRRHQLVPVLLVELDDLAAEAGLGFELRLDRKVSRAEAIVFYSNLIGKR